jgi:AAA+ superfamily predicted ATPase
VTNLISAQKSTDIIDGKGNGLTMLLHGGPGTGKTFTAESVAEIAHKPLYRVTCGDIGTTPKEVETYLESVLHLGRIWNCVVLLDEADIFLEERSLYDLQRNALVSTFLRVLEYFNGILILTSNRVGRFDEAFRSRIMLALHYKPLTHDQRRQVWRNFFRRLQDLDGTKISFEKLMRHVEDLADHNLNGREIRNVITISRQLAKYRDKQLDHEIIQDVVQKTSLFDKYLLDLNEGNTGDAMARELGVR